MKEAHIIIIACAFMCLLTLLTSISIHKYEMEVDWESFYKEKVEGVCK